MPKLTFEQRAQRLGHSLESLRAGHRIRSIISVPHVDALKDLLDDGSSPEERQANHDALFGSEAVPGPDEAPGMEGIMRRTQAYVFGNADLSDGDRQRIQTAFPMDVFAESSLDPQTYDAGPTSLNVSGATIATYNYSTVTFQDQAYVTINNQTLLYSMQSLVRNGSPPAGWGDFNILGATGATGSAGITGPAGGDGSPGKKGNCSSAGIAGDSGQNGGQGATGGVGGSGGQGDKGAPSLAATITVSGSVTSATGQILILTRSGTGGIGGEGGVGGQGGKGGKGGNGATCDCTGSGAGNGGNGGPGGTGGPGGMGGSAVNAGGNVIVQVPSGNVGMIQPLAFTAPPGGGGTGGAGGAGGSPGGGGSGGKHNGDGSKGSTGGSGSPGGRGTQGTESGTPATISVQPY